MRTESSSSGARVKKKKRSSEHSKRHDKPAEGEWKQFTSPDGHLYYYNSVTKESRWELPTESEIPIRSKHRRPKGSSKQVELGGEGDAHQEQAPSSNEKKKKRPESAALDRQEPNDTPKPKNAMFQKLQASLEGRFNAMNNPMMGMGRPPPMLNIRREEEEYTGGATAESEMKSQTLEEQYEAETAGMSAAERLRFLRKKRQENMMTKRDSVVGDDFMAEVANNMKKKEATRKPLEKKSSNTVPSWKEQEEAEEERKRRQMQAEIEAKEQEEARKEREQQAAIEREQRREQERAEQLALEQRRQDERKQRQAKESHQTQEKEEKRKKRKNKKEDASGSADQLEGQSFDHEINNTDKTGVVGTLERDQMGGDELPDERLDVSSSEHLKHRGRSRSRSRGSKNGVLNISVQQSKQAANTGGESLPEQIAVSGEEGEDAAQRGKQRKREERRAKKLRQQELSASSSRASVTPESPRRNSISSANGHKEEPSTRSTSSIESEEEIRAREKQLRRERRRMAKVEAAFAAQNLDRTGDQGALKHKRDRSDGQEYRGEGREGRSSSSNGSSYPGGSMDGQQQAGQAQFSGGMYPPYPYMMMPPPPPPPTPYGYYYPYMQPPPMVPMYPPGMVGVPPGYKFMPPTPPPSMDGMGTPSAMVPYGADSTLASFGAMYGAPELSRCDCCKGIGIGLVEKNGVCAHCNRLKLAFIVDSVQMRQRCSICGGWGFQLLQANGMCEHCTRQTAQKSLPTNDTARRRSSVAAVRGTSVPVSAPPRRNSTGNSKSGGLDDVDWDKSSSDDSDWDE